MDQKPISFSATVRQRSDQAPMLKQTYRILVFALVAVTTVAQSASAQQSFSCPYGKQASCLDYGDKVCSQFGKCVDGNAQCFTSSTCFPDGFVCKSDMDDLIDKAKKLSSDYDGLKDCISYATDLAAAKQCSLMY